MGDLQPVFAELLQRLRAAQLYELEGDRAGRIATAAISGNTDWT